jgi:uncharacterized protein (TIGR02453 family)
MEWIGPEFMGFFVELAGNNHKEWFDAHRERYEKVVKAPFENAVSRIVDVLKSEDPYYDIDPKKTIFRINRDVRFSKDKSPYKLQMGASINPGGQKTGRIPGLYFEIGPGGFNVGGGAYFLEKPDQELVWRHVSLNRNRWLKADQEPDFRRYYSDGIIGEERKKAVPEFLELGKTEPLVRKKQWYWWAELPPEQSFGPELVELIAQHHRASSSIRQLLNEALLV